LWKNLWWNCAGFPWVCGPNRITPSPFWWIYMDLCGFPSRKWRNHQSQWQIYRKLGASEHYWTQWFLRCFVVFASERILGDTVLLRWSGEGSQTMLLKISEKNTFLFTSQAEIVHHFEMKNRWLPFRTHHLLYRGNPLWVYCRFPGFDKLFLWYHLNGGCKVNGKDDIQ
jgi:hypothetical protein